MAILKKELLSSPFPKDRHTNSHSTCILHTDIMKPRQSAEFCLLICKQAATQTAVATWFYVCSSVLLFWQTSNLGFEIAPSLLQCLALTFSGNAAGGSVYSRLQNARCTAVNGSDFANYTKHRHFYLW